MKNYLLYLLLFIQIIPCFSQNREEQDSLKSNKYYNPIEQRTYTTDGEFKKYKGGKEVKSFDKGQKETSLDQIVFLSSDADMKESSSVDDLTDIVNRTNSIFERLFKDSESPGYIMIQFDLKKKKNEIQFAVRDDIDLDIMAEFEKAVNKEKYPKSKNKPIKFQLIYKVNSYSISSEADESSEESVDETEDTPAPNNNVLIIVDGEKSSKAELEKIDVNKIEKVEIIKNKEDVKKYTSEDYDGIIFIYLKKEKKNEE